MAPKADAKAVGKAKADAKAKSKGKDEGKRLRPTAALSSPLRPDGSRPSPPTATTRPTTQK